MLQEVDAPAHVSLPYLCFDTAIMWKVNKIAHLNNLLLAAAAIFVKLLTIF